MQADIQGDMVDMGTLTGTRVGGADDALWVCRLRGRFRREKQDILPGDLVTFTVTDEGGRIGVIESVLPRVNRLSRPTVANTDNALIVMAVDSPKPDLWLLDRLLLIVAAQEISPILCWNKADLAEEGSLEQLIKPYEAAGIAQVVTSAVKETGLDDLSRLLAHKSTVLAGQSGVGKSSLLNMIIEGISLKTGEISERIGRGRHTTRHVEWIPLTGGGWVADTPGFSQITMPESIMPDTLAAYYDDFDPFLEGCRFRSCRHDQEQDCGVSLAAREGDLDEGRYNRYLSFLQEIKDRGRG